MSNAWITVVQMSISQIWHVDAQHGVLHPRNGERLTSLHSHTAAKKGIFLSIIEGIEGILDQSTVLLEDQYVAQKYRNNTTLLSFNTFKYSIDV